jgi:hypothetical protein
MDEFQISNRWVYKTPPESYMSRASHCSATTSVAIIATFTAIDIQQRLGQNAAITQLLPFMTATHGIPD